MIQFMRSLFGRKKTPADSSVTGAPETAEPKEEVFIKDSENRLGVLYKLQHRYKGTLHEEKIKAVYEKTKKIHSYLIAEKRLYELELFHIQNTDNFISTFTLIIDVHQKHKENIESIFDTLHADTEQEFEGSQTRNESVNGKGELFEIVERVKKRKQGQTVTVDEPVIEVPSLSIPEISINTNATVFYLKENFWGKPVPKEIGFTSTSQEKETFQAYTSARLGMSVKEVYYVGNARINLPFNQGNTFKGMVPIIYLKSHAYALSLSDYRVFPVKIMHKQ